MSSVLNSLIVNGREFGSVSGAHWTELLLVDRVSPSSCCWICLEFMFVFRDFMLDGCDFVVSSSFYFVLESIGCLVFLSFVPAPLSSS